MRLQSAFLISVFALTLSVNGAPLTGSFTTGGTTTGSGSGPYDMTSDNFSFAVLRFVPDQALTFSNWTSLSYAYNSLLGGIGAGAPRSVFVVDNNNDNVSDGQFIVHWGPAGSFVDPSLGAANTGNLLALLDNGRYDLGGIGGSAYTDRAAALTLAGNYNILRVSLIIDSFGGNDRHFVIDGVQAEGDSAVPEPASLGLFGAGLAMLALFRRRN